MIIEGGEKFISAVDGRMADGAREKEETRRVGCIFSRWSSSINDKFVRSKNDVGIFHAAARSDRSRKSKQNSVGVPKKERCS